MKKIGILSCALSLFAMTSCQDWLDVNADPNNLSELADPTTILPVAQLSVANTMMGWDTGLTGGVWCQYYTQDHTASQFKAAEEYTENSFAGTYNELYTGALNDLKVIKRTSDELGAVGSAFVAEVLSIYTWQIVTDTWGTVPYFEALSADEGVYSPNFDEGDVIYADLEKRIDAAIATDLSSASLSVNNDFYYGGDLTKWMQFAKALKVKLMMRQSETSSFNASAVISFVEANIDDLNAFESTMVDGSVYFTDTDGKRHPQAEVQAGGANYYSTNIIASKTFLDYLRINEDPRINSIYVPTEDGHFGSFQGDFDSKEDSDADGTNDDKEDFSTVEFAYNDNLYIISEWELNFLIAEAYALNSNAAKAEEFYKNGVLASLDFHEIDETSILDSGYAKFVAGTPEEMVKQVAMQRWVAFAKTQHWESFLERNRTKYPAVNEIDIAADRQAAFTGFPVGDFVISVAGRAKLDGALPSSLTYPSSVLQRNTSATKPDQKSNLGQKIWWDQKAGK